jgi:chemotaxis protein methyltransferase CheR
MNRPQLTADEFRLIRSLVQKECGIAVGDEKSYLIETRLSTLVVEAGCETFRQFYDKVVAQPQLKLRDKIVDAMTTNETLWFRDEGPWRIFNKELIPT